MSKTKDESKIKMYEPFVSTAKNKKYSVYVFKDGVKRLIHFGDSRYEHFKDTTKLKAWSKLDHGDMERRRLYLARALNIKNKDGIETYKLLHSPNYWSVKYLWSYVDLPRVPMKTTFKRGYLYNEVLPVLDF